MKKSSRTSKPDKPVKPATDAGRGTRTIKSFRWAVGGIITLILIPIGLQLWFTYWNRPQLSISVAKALVGSIRTVRSDGIYEHRAVLDLQRGCVTALFEYVGDNNFDLPPPDEARPPRMVYGLYLENVGRSEITDIRLTFRSQNGGFEILGSPQLALASSEQRDPEGQTVKTVTIASMASGAKGVITGTLPVDGVELTVERSDDGAAMVRYATGGGDPRLVRDRHVRFVGARQLTEKPLESITVDELFTLQQKAFELTALPVPIDPVELSGLGGSSFSMRGPFKTCPGDSCKCYQVPVVQRALTEAEKAMTEEERDALKNRPPRPHKHLR